MDRTTTGRAATAIGKRLGPALRNFAGSRRGATAIEYALVASIAAVIFAAVANLGEGVLNNLFLKVVNGLETGEPE